MDDQWDKTGRPGQPPFISMLQNAWKKEEHHFLMRYGWGQVIWNNEPKADDTGRLWITYKVWSLVREKLVQRLECRLRRLLCEIMVPFDRFAADIICPVAPDG